MEKPLNSQEYIGFLASNILILDEDNVAVLPHGNDIDMDINRHIIGYTDSPIVGLNEQRDTTFPKRVLMGFGDTMAYFQYADDDFLSGLIIGFTTHNKGLKPRYIVEDNKVPIIFA